VLAGIEAALQRGESETTIARPTSLRARSAISPPNQSCEAAKALEQARRKVIWRARDGPRRAAGELTRRVPELMHLQNADLNVVQK